MTGCGGELTQHHFQNSIENQATQNVRTQKSDSIGDPYRYTPVIHGPLAATSKKQMEVQQESVDGFAPMRIAATEPQIRTPGQGIYKLPEKIEAKPQYGTIPSPEKIRLKEPISIGENPYSFMTHTKVQGLSHDNVFSFCEDESGNMWIGTFGGGLMRYDGRDIYWFNNTPWGEMPEVITLRNDKYGAMWATTGKGLFRLDGHQIFYFNAQEGGLRHESLESIQFDDKGNLWISYWEGGISKYDGQYFYHYGEEQGLKEQRGQVLQKDNEGNIWITGGEEGIYQYKEGAFFLYNVPLVTKEHPILAIGKGDKNEIWLSIYEVGVANFDGNEFSFFTTENGFPHHEIYQIKSDGSGSVWFASWGKGLIRWNEERFFVFRKEQGLYSELINCIYIDSNNVLWVGFTGGMARYQGDIFEHFTTQQSFDTHTTSMVRCQAGKLWITSFSGPLMSFEGNSFTSFSLDAENPSEFAEGLVVDSGNHLWMAINQEGIYRFDGSDFYHYQLDSLEYPLSMEGGMEDKDGNLWLLTGRQGVLKFDGETFTHFNQNNGLPVNHVRAIAEDPEGNIVLATFGGGVVVVDDNKFTIYTEEDGLASNYLFSAFTDSEDNLWFGTNGKGVSMFNGSNFINFTTTKGLTDNYIFSIAQDAEGSMVFGGRFGLNVMTYNTLKEVMRKNDLHVLPNIDNHYFINYTYNEGFLGVGANMGMMLREDDKIWIGTNNRITRFNSSLSLKEVPAPNVVISELELFNEELNWKALLEQQDTLILLANGVKLKDFSFDRISPWHHIPENLQLSHKNNFITFGFSGASPSSGNKILYSFKLEGFDPHWHKPTTENHAHYGNLPPGKYTLKVKARNNYGLWSQQEQLSFVILTPWWKKWWAFVLYFGAAGVILMMYIRVREKALVLENKILDNEVELARKTIEIKQNIIANVSHELRTPLTGIIGLADILAKTPLNEQQKEYIHTLQQTGINLKEIINQILDYSKIESGEVSLTNTSFSVRELFLHAEKVFDSLKQNKSNLRIITHIEENVPPLIFADRGRVNQILLNLLYNAVKFTHEGSITLKASLENTFLSAGNTGTARYVIKISVIDTGLGISEEAIKKLFVPFSQIENNDTRETDSTGLGLAISKKLANLLKGNIGVESKPGVGSRFWYTFLAGQPEGINPVQSSNVDLVHEAKNKNILLVEDKKVNQLVIKLMLKGMGHKVELAENGEEALQVFEPGKFDFILMDIQMPVMDGIRATQKLKEQYSDLPPIIGLSANAFEGDREKYMGLGMDEYITKPVNDESLRKVLAQMDLKE